MGDTSTTKDRLNRWATKWLDAALVKGRQSVVKFGVAFRKHPFNNSVAASVIVLFCGGVYPRQTLEVLGLVTVALVSVFHGTFWMWARRWKAALTANDRDIPTRKELKATYQKLQLREKKLAEDWPKLCIMHGVHTNKRTPMLLNITPTIDEDFQAFIPRTGFDPDDIKAKAPKIAKGLGCTGGVIVRETATGCAEVTFNWTDLLRRQYPLRDMPVASSDDKGAFGVAASGEAMSLDLDMSTAYIGSPRSGKSVTQDAWFCDRVDMGEWLNLYVSNPKTNEMKMFKKYLGRQMNRVRVVAYAEGEKPAPHVALINQFEQDMAERNRNMKGKKLTKSTAENPRCVLWLDEMLLLPKSVYKDRGDEFSPLRRCLAGGPAAMFTVMGGTQLVYSEDFGAVKGLFTQRVVLRLPSPEITDTAFYRGAVADGAACHTLHKTHDRGVGWALNDDGELTKFRSPKVEDWDVERALQGLPTQGRALERVKEPAAEKPEQVVYFIEAQGTDLVKIGIAAVPTDRLRELQTASPHKLAILGTMPGGISQERQFHRRFAASRATGEWFHRTPELDELIVQVQAGEFAPEKPAGTIRHARDWMANHTLHMHSTSKTAKTKPPVKSGPDFLPWLPADAGRSWR